MVPFGKAANPNEIRGDDEHSIYFWLKVRNFLIHWWGKHICEQWGSTAHTTPPLSPKSGRSEDILFIDIDIKINYTCHGSFLLWIYISTTKLIVMNGSLWCFLWRFHNRFSCAIRPTKSLGRAGFLNGHRTCRTPRPWSLRTGLTMLTPWEDHWFNGLD